MQIDCSRANELIPQYLAGELPEEEYQALKEHAEACEKCNELLGHYRALIEEGRNAEPALDFESVWCKITENLDGDVRPKAWLLDLMWSHKLLAGLCAVCVIVTLLFVFMKARKVQPAMSVAEMEQILREVGEIREERGEGAPSDAGEPYSLLGSSANERVLKLAGVGSDNGKAYEIEPF